MNIDIGPTLLQMSGCEIPSTMQGESFLPMLKGESRGRSAPILYEYFQEEYAPGIPTIIAIRTPEWKYVNFPYELEEEGNFDELYHLTNDPHELKNLALSPEYTSQLNTMRRLFERAEGETAYTPPPYRYSPPSEVPAE